MCRRLRRRRDGCADVRRCDDRDRRDSREHGKPVEHGDNLCTRIDAPADVVVEIGQDDTAAPEPLLDVRDRIVELDQTRDDERGLLGLVFHPDYQRNRRVFAFYTERPGESAPSTLDHVNVLSEFRVAEDGVAVDPGSERRAVRVGDGGHRARRR